MIEKEKRMAPQEAGEIRKRDTKHNESRVPRATAAHTRAHLLMCLNWIGFYQLIIILPLLLVERASQ